MTRQRLVILGSILGLLLVANVVSYYYNSWGLITIHVTDAPVRRVLKSIEWQGWVKIYTNVPETATVSMNVDHVPLAEAMETLVVNVNLNDNSAQPTPNQRGARGARVQWNLGFFVAPSSAALKQQINAFQDGASADDVRIYSYPTPLGLLATDDDAPAADPRKQTWPGFEALKAAAASVPLPAPGPDGTPSPAPAPPKEPDSAQGVLRAFAQSANIWIMAPANWDPAVKQLPAPSSSITGAVKSFVSSLRGTVTSALVVNVREVGRRGPGGPGQGDGGGGGGDYSTMAVRVRNAINGLPEEAQADALVQAEEEQRFYRDVMHAPPEVRQQLIQQHRRGRVGNNNSRRNPENRAKFYSNVVANRQAAQGKR